MKIRFFSDGILLSIKGKNNLEEVDDDAEYSKDPREIVETTIQLNDYFTISLMKLIKEHSEKYQISYNKRCDKIDKEYNQGKWKK